MKHFNIVSGTAVVPLLARIVLCAAFLTTGWNKLMNVDEFTGEAADSLIERGVDDVVRVLPRTAEPGPPASPTLHDANDEDPAHTQADGLDLRRLFPQEPQEAVIEDDPETGERVLITKRLHQVTLILIGADLPAGWPVRLSWLLAITEFVGGALLLVGLFSRLWGFALAAAMLGAFWWTTVPKLIEVGGPFAIAEDFDAFHGMYAQLGLFVLAITVLLVGPGPVSLDRLIFHHRTAPKEGEYASKRHDFATQPPHTTHDNAGRPGEAPTSP